MQEKAGDGNRPPLHGLFGLRRFRNELDAQIIAQRAAVQNLSLIHILGSAVGYTGAPYLAAAAAVRTGCGLVSLGCLLYTSVLWPILKQ